MATLTLNGSTSGYVIVTVPPESGANTITFPAATGTLSLANTSTSGGIFFGGATSGVLYQDASNLYWDDTNNRLGIGTNSPSYPLSIASSAATNTTSIGLTGSTTGYQRILMNNTSGGAQLGIEGSSAGTICVGSSAYATIFGSYNNYATQFITNNTVVGTFSTSGYLGIGTASPTAGLTISGTGDKSGIDFTNTTASTGRTYRWVSADNGNFYLTDRTASADRLFVDSSGNFNYNITGPGGTPSSSARMAVGSTSVDGLNVRTTSNGAAILVDVYTGSAAGGGYFLYFRNGSSNTTVGYISTSASAVTYYTPSDYRLKENVVPIQDSLDIVSGLKPCYYNFKTEPDHVLGGFLAHELAEVAPYAVDGEKDAVDEEGKIKPQAADVSKLTAVLTAAIQELIAKNDALEARLAALEGAN